MIHRTWGEGRVQGYDGDLMTAVFADAGYKTVDWRFMRDEGLLVPADSSERSGSPGTPERSGDR